MEHVTSFLVASAYSAFSPAYNVAATCAINGQPAECPAILGILGTGTPIAFLVIFLIIIAGMWKTYVKAGQPGWASIIPIYNLIVLMKIINKPVWWVIFYFIPLINIIISFVMMYELAKSFGKGVGYMLGLIFLPFIFYPMLGFGKAEYTRSAGEPMVTVNA
jgi:hypothetical protein